MNLQMLTQFFLWCTILNGILLWKHALVLLCIFIFGSFIGLVLVPWTGWSDARSHWGEPLFIFLLSFGLTVATHWLYRKPGRLYKAQAVGLWMLFGVVAAVAAYRCVLAWLFIYGYLKY